MRPLAWRREVFARYAESRRAAHIPSFKVDVLGDVTRHVPLEGDEAVLSFARFKPDAAAQRIRGELANLERHGWHAEWKVHDFDEPGDLRERLRSHGLASHHDEALMVLAVRDWQPRASAEACDIAIEEARGAALDEIAAFQESVWKCRLPWLAGVLHATSDPASGTGIVYCARDGRRVVGSGWIDFHRGSPFAQLCGGAVDEAYRGNGLYSMLFDCRLAEARRRGTEFIAVDAAPMSRPILERKGFELVCDVYPMRTRPFETGAVTRS